MKLNFSPEFAYILGFWRSAKAGPGIGVKGPAERLSVFVSALLDYNIIDHKKILTDGPRVYFYHSKYKKFLEKLEEELSERIKYLNDYSSAYFAGVFDASGTIDKEGKVILPYEEKNFLILNKLNFPPIRKKSIMFVSKPALFLEFIKKYRRYL